MPSITQHLKPLLTEWKQNKVIHEADVRANRRFNRMAAALVSQSKADAYESILRDVKSYRTTLGQLRPIVTKWRNLILDLQVKRAECMHTDAVASMQHEAEATIYRKVIKDIEDLFIIYHQTI